LLSYINPAVFCTVMIKQATWYIKQRNDLFILSARSSRGKSPSPV
jgi:hypothetical protein